LAQQGVGRVRVFDPAGEKYFDAHDLGMVSKG
jgi:hypothetical protein